MEIPHSPDKMIYNLNTHYFKVASLAQGEAIQYLQLLAKEAMHFNDGMVHIAVHLMCSVAIHHCVYLAAPAQVV